MTRTLRLSYSKNQKSLNNHTSGSVGSLYCSVSVDNSHQETFMRRGKVSHTHSEKFKELQTQGMEDMMVLHSAVRNRAGSVARPLPKECRMGLLRTKTGNMA